MASNSEILNEKILEVIARKQSINFDKGQAVVSKYFDELLEKIKNISRSPRITAPGLLKQASIILRIVSTHLFASQKLFSHLHLQKLAL